jgi:hypothetical protein
MALKIVMSDSKGTVHVQNVDRYAKLLYMEPKANGLKVLKHESIKFE